MNISREYESEKKIAFPIGNKADQTHEKQEKRPVDPCQGRTPSKHKQHIHGM